MPAVMTARDATHSIALFLGLLCACPGLTEPGDKIVFADPPAPASTSVAAVAPTPTPTPAPAPSAPPADEQQIRASHILISWKGASRSSQTRTKDDAKRRADQIYARAKKGEDFAKLAAEFGEDATKAAGGDLGTFGHGRMVPAFEAAAFALKVGEISPIVETQFGFHIIKRTQ